MSDREKCTFTPPPSPSPEPRDLDWERYPTFRHTFLAHFPLDVADSVEELGRALYHLVLAFGPGAPAQESWTTARLRATAADLHVHAAFLRDLAREREASSLSESDARLSDRAKAWADQAQGLASRIEAALA